MRAGLCFLAILIVASALAAARCAVRVPDTVRGPETFVRPPYSAPECLLLGRAVLPALTFAEGPPSGAFLGTGPIRGVRPPFERQPVQGFSGLIANNDFLDSIHLRGGTFLALADNGYGEVETSADFRLRVYKLRPEFSALGLREPGIFGGTVAVEGFIELRDPDRHLPFAIVNGFTDDRVLTGLDLDPESIARAPDGTLWIGDEVGPFLLHFDATGRLLEPPFSLPDVRAPRSPLTVSGGMLRVLAAMRARGRSLGARTDPVCSPWHMLLAESDVASIRKAGFPVVVWTVNDEARMRDLVKVGVDGIITDRPDLAAWIDRSRIDVQGHRGARDLRPENTLPAIEAALDHRVTTVEIDCGITKDGVPVLGHDPEVSSRTTRRADGAPYGPADEVPIADLTLAELQTRFIADRVFRGPMQSADLALSPVAVTFAQQRILPHPYTIPTLADVFAFVDFYARHRGRPTRVRFNIETKTGPHTRDPAAFARAVADAIVAAGLEERADVQSFDLRTLLEVQTRYPRIRTVCLFGDPDDVSPALAGFPWPYRRDDPRIAPRARTSGGYEGLAISPDGTRLYPILEKPLEGDDPRTLLIHEFDIAARRFTDARWRYPLDPRATAVGDFILVDERRGLAIERDDSQGNLDGFKRIFEVDLGPPGDFVGKHLVADLLQINDYASLSRLPGAPGDVGIGRRFALPFWTIEGLAFVRGTVYVVTDNNFPFPCGRHLGTGAPDDTEIVWLRIYRRP